MSGGGAGHAHLHNAFLTDNDTDVYLQGGHNLFSGAMAIDAPSSCHLDPGLEAPGITDATATPPCASSDGSTALFVTGQTAQSAFIGKVSAGDPMNAHAVDAYGTFPYASISDFTTFHLSRFLTN